MKRSKHFAVTVGLFTAAILALEIDSANAILNIETVFIDAPGNTADTEVMNDGTTGYGQVDYTYYMGKFEVTAGQYTEFLNSVARHSDPYDLWDTTMWSGSYACKINRGWNGERFVFSVEPDWANRPVNYISWANTVRFANWLHNGQPTGVQDLTTTEDGSYLLNGAMTNEELATVTRKPDWRWAVPNEDEWYKAAYFDSSDSTYHNYATGSDDVPGFITRYHELSGTGEPYIEGGIDPGNYATHNMVASFGTNAPYYRTVVGEWENSASPYGTYDQYGNVKELTETLSAIDPNYFILRDVSMHFQDRGGRSDYRTRREPNYRQDSVGFRVVSRVPEPIALTLYLLGVPALLARKRG